MAYLVALVVGVVLFIVTVPALLGSEPITVSVAAWTAGVLLLLWFVTRTLGRFLGALTLIVIGMFLYPVLSALDVPTWLAVAATLAPVAGLYFVTSGNAGLDGIVSVEDAFLALLEGMRSLVTTVLKTMITIAAVFVSGYGLYLLYAEPSQRVLGGLLLAVGGLVLAALFIRRSGTREAKEIATQMLQSKGVTTTMAKDTVYGRVGSPYRAAANLGNDIQDFVKMIANLPRKEREKLASVLGPEAADGIAEGYRMQIDVIVKKSELILEQELLAVNRQLALVKLKDCIQAIDAIEVVLLEQVKKGRIDARSLDIVMNNAIALHAAEVVASIQGSKASVTDSLLLDTVNQTQTLLTRPLNAEPTQLQSPSVQEGDVGEGSIDVSQTSPKELVEQLLAKTRPSAYANHTNGHKRNGGHS